MKILVLCVDRDDDIGVKTGIKTPLIGREANLNAATKLGLADPEDSDVNALLSAISTYDGLVRDGQLAEIATICGDVHVGSSSDLILAQQLDQVLEQVRPDRVFLVSDGAEDEAFAPIVGSRVRVDHVRRVYVRQTPTAESLYYTLGRQLKNPKVRRKIVAPLGFVLLLFGAIWLAVPGAAAALVLILAGLYLLMISLPFQSVGDVLDRAGELYNRLRDSVASGNLSIFFNVSALILVLVGISFGVDSASRVAEPSYVVKFLAGALASVWFFVLGLLLFEGGKVLTAYMQHGRAPRHALAVAVTFIAVGFIVLAMINILGVLLASYNLNASVADLPEHRTGDLPRRDGRPVLSDAGTPLGDRRRRVARLRIRMEFESWEPFYLQILKDFGFLRQADEEVARELDASLGGTRASDQALRSLFEGKEVTVAGNGPNLAREIEGARGVLVTADEATTVPMARGRIPAAVVPDLDGTMSEPGKPNDAGAIVLVHGHGDKGPAGRKWAPRSV